VWLLEFLSLVLWEKHENWPVVADGIHKCPCSVVSHAVSHIEMADRRQRLSACLHFKLQSLPIVMLGWEGDRCFGLHIQVYYKRAAVFFQLLVQHGLAKDQSGMERREGLRHTSGDVRVCVPTHLIGWRHESGRKGYLIPDLIK
jgi:hypothetical protein